MYILCFSRCYIKKNVLVQLAVTNFGGMLIIQIDE